jgi:hypothetical protein
MRPRTDLQTILEDLLGTRNVYFQPPENVKMQYPCIVYELSSERYSYADNIKYRQLKRYSITVIDRDPDTEIPDKLRELKYCSFERYFRSENLNHFVFEIYF